MNRLMQSTRISRYTQPDFGHLLNTSMEILNLACSELKSLSNLLEHSGALELLRHRHTLLRTTFGKQQKQGERNLTMNIIRYKPLRKTSQAVQRSQSPRSFEGAEKGENKSMNHWIQLQESETGSSWGVLHFEIFNMG